MLLLDTNLPLLFYFVKTERAIPKENHMRPEGWLCYSIEALLQSVHGWQCRQITDRESQREGKKQRKETQGDAVYHKSCLHHWKLFNLFKLSRLNAFRNLCLSSEKVKCIWITCDTQYIDVGKWFTFFFLSLLLSQCGIIEVSLGYVYRAGLSVNGMREKKRGEKLDCLAVL